MTKYTLLTPVLIYFIVLICVGCFKIVCGYTLKAEKKSTGLWTATSMFGGSYPLDVKVMYEEKDTLMGRNPDIAKNFWKM